MGENHFEKNPVALYGIVLLLASIAYKILSNLVIKKEGKESLIAKALGKKKKENYSIAFYVAAVIIAFVQPIASVAIYFLIAIVWIIPDKRIEKSMK